MGVDRAPDKEYLLGADASEIIVTSIPQGGRKLIFTLMGESTVVNATDIVLVELNGDTDVNDYESATVQTGFGGISYGDNNNRLVALPGQGTADTGVLSTWRFEIPYYSSFGAKVIHGIGDVGNFKSLAMTGHQFVRWFDPSPPTPPVEQMRFILQNADFKAGFVVSLWLQ